MNWLKQLRTILGKFWYIVFKELGFIFGLELLEGMYAKLLENAHLNWFAGLIAKNLGIKPDHAPFVIYIDKDRCKQLGYSAADFFASDQIEASQPNPDAGYLAPVLNVVPIPYILQDHLVNYKHVWFKGCDYEYTDGALSFKANIPISDYGLSEVMRIRPGSTEPVLCYRIFGWTRRTVRFSDAVYGLLDPMLVDYADIVWNMHQNGATRYLAKKLLAATSYSLVSDNAGTVVDVWDEDNGTLHCVQVGDKVYYSTDPVVVAVTAGTEVKAGTVLFGTTSFPEDTDTDPTQEAIPGVDVMTDVGRQRALNQSSTPVTYGNSYILNLSGGTLYEDRCKQLIDDQTCPRINATAADYENPYLFITRILRRNRDLVCVVSTPGPLFDNAVECIRKHMHAGGILSIYVNAETADTDVEVSGEANASVNATTSEGSITISDNGTDAEVA